MESYGAFRRGLLRHISIEERVLFPELRKRFGRTPVEMQLHRDHAALTALLVPPPTVVEVEQLRAILGTHNDLEERGGGMYEDVEALEGIDMADLMRRVHAIAQVPVLPNVDNEVVRRSIAQLLREAEVGRRSLQK